MKKFGIDISQYQPSSAIDYDVLSEQIDFAIIRAGGTFRKEWDFYYDTEFDEHYAQLTARGIPLGAYWYSTASTAEEGQQEAEEMLTCIAGKSFTYPIVIDVEEPRCTTDGVIGFCERIEGAGHYVAIYANTNYLCNILDSDRLTPYDIWLANWSDSPSSPLPYGMWQYTSDGDLRGYNGRLDCDYAYKDYPSIIANIQGNGETHPLDVKKTVTELANEVLQGQWGNGQERVERLTDAGYDYDAVQSIVNEKLGVSGATSEPEYHLYTVESGDSLWAIAEAEYGDGQKMYDIARYNGINIDDTIYPGDVLKIPEVI